MASHEEWHFSPRTILTGGVMAGVALVAIANPGIAHADGGEPTDQSQSSQSDDMATTTPDQTVDPTVVTKQVKVVTGDTPDGIAARYNTSLPALVEANPKLSSIPVPGDVINVPVNSGPAPAEQPAVTDGGKTTPKDKTVASDASSQARAAVINYGGIRVVNPSGPTVEANPTDVSPAALATSPGTVTASPAVQTGANVTKDANIKSAAPVFDTKFAKTSAFTTAAVAAPEMTAPIEPVATQLGTGTQRPVSVKTNAPAIVSVDSTGAVSVEVISADTTSAPATQATDGTTAVAATGNDGSTPGETAPGVGGTETPAATGGKTSPTPSISGGTETPSVPAATETPSTAYSDYLAAQNLPALPSELQNLKNQTDSISNPHAKIAARQAAYKDFTNWLFSSFTPTKEGFDAFKASGVNLSATDVFINKNPINQGKTINPTCTVTHLMAGNPSTVQQFAEQMKYDVQFATMHNGTVYQTTPAPNTYAFQAAGMNSTCIGNENAGFDILDVTPAQAESNVYFELWLSEQFGFDITRDLAGIDASPTDSIGDFVPNKASMDATSLKGHKEGDKIYNPKPTGKIDPPSFFMDALYRKIIAFRDGQPDSSATSKQTLTSDPNAVTSTVRMANIVENNTTNTGGVNMGTVNAANVTDSATQLRLMRTNAFQKLIDQPVLTGEQFALKESAKAAGFTPTILSTDHTVPLVIPGTASTVPGAATTTGGSAGGSAGGGSAPGGQAPHTTEKAVDLPPAITSLLSDEILHPTVVKTPAQAFADSSHAKMNGGTLGATEAFGPQLPIGDEYVVLRTEGETPTEAAVLEATSTRETNREYEAVGDLGSNPSAGFVPGVKASFGVFQSRYIDDTNPLRDPQSNLNPLQAIKNASDMYEQTGASPWEVVMPDTLTEDSIFQAIRLPNRDLGDKRAAFDARMRTIAHDVFQMAQEMEPKVQAALGTGAQT